MHNEFEDVLISKILAAHSEKSIMDYTKTIYSSLVDFTGKTTFEDDVCIIGMEIT